MSKDQAKFSNGMLTLTAKKVSGQPDAVHGGQNIKIHYLAGAVHAKEHFNVSRGGGYDFSGEFKATTTKGTWPAFWLTAVDGWPPEIDMAEWKGSGKIVSTISAFYAIQTPDSPTHPLCPSRREKTTNLQIGSHSTRLTLHRSFPGKMLPIRPQTSFTRLSAKYEISTRKST